MRLVAKFDHERDASKFQAFLTQKGIESRSDPERDEKSNQLTYSLWIYKDDDVAEAINHYNHYVENPSDPRYLLAMPPKAQPAQEEEEQEIKRPSRSMRKPHLTIFIVLFCTMVFFWDISQKVKAIPPFVNQSTIIMTPLEEALFYDVPDTFLLLTEFWKNVAKTADKKAKDLTPQQKNELIEIEKIPYWKGLYDLVLYWPESRSFLKSPLFSKIRDGEVYRLITPIILHGNLLHILFNMLWVWVLGKMIEERISRLRYLALMVVVALISNTVQYLMTGPAFLGYSGVICGMAGFIWMRQKVAPWEGYPLERITALFLGIFIFGMLAFQIFLFVIERFTTLQLNLQIANSAHISGALVGMALGRIPLFYKGLE